MPLFSTKEHFTHSSSSFFRLVANQWTAWAIRIVVLLRVNTIRKTMNTTTINGKRLYIKSYIHLRSFNASETALYKLCGIMYWSDSAHQWALSIQYMMHGTATCRMPKECLYFTHMKCPVWLHPNHQISAATHG